MDKIVINQMQFYGYHGVLPEENRLGQRFNVDVELYVDLQKAAYSDDVADTVNYADVYLLTKEVVEGTPKKLIEAVAEEIAKAILTNFILVQSCMIRVIKPDPPIPGHYQSVAIEINRVRENA